MNFHGLNPSMGASFQAPPAAVSQPPTPPMSIDVQPGSDGSACSIAAAAAQVRTRPATTAGPTV